MPLAGMGATQIQGYLYGKPTSAEQAAAILGAAAQDMRPASRVAIAG